MSDFDREAERERLREKYERDREKRESTQRMSELLLRGATMTDSHCDDCGDPIFRYEGQEFCATCQAEGASAESAEREAGTGDEDASVATTPTDAAENGQPAPDSDPEPEPAPRQRAAPAPEPEPRGTPRTPAVDRTGAGTTEAEAGADLRAARESLVRTVARFARRAEETDSPREAADHLAAAREAAEALAALDRR